MREKDYWWWWCSPVGAVKSDDNDDNDAARAHARILRALDRMDGDDDDDDDEVDDADNNDRENKTSSTCQGRVDARSANVDVDTSLPHSVASFAAGRVAQHAFVLLERRARHRQVNPLKKRCK